MSYIDAKAASSVAPWISNSQSQSSGAVASASGANRLSNRATRSAGAKKYA